MLIRTYVSRCILVFLSLILCLITFSVKLVLIQVFRSAHLATLAQRQHNHSLELEAIRGTIFDRKLRPLALNVPAYSLFADPRVMSESDKEIVVRHLSVLLDLDPVFIQKRLRRDKGFVWLARKLPMELVDKINQWEVPGLDFMNESKRHYPNGDLAAHLIGFAGIDNIGLEGLELFYNKELKGTSGWTKTLRDAKQRELMIKESIEPPVDGFHLILTIDETIQYIAEHSLQEAFEKYKAKAASIIVMDIQTGEILALANRPTYNLEKVATSNIESRTNRAIGFVYEPGSVFKIVTASAALERNVFQEDDKIFCENGEYRVANHILHDHHPHKTLSFQGVFEQSSNIGVTKIAQKLGSDVIYEYAQKFRFGMKTNIDLLGEVPGVLKPPAVWSKTSIAAIPIGHEVAVTPLQLVCAIAAIANDGLYMRPFVVKYIKDHRDQVIQSFEPEIVSRVINVETARRVKEILVGVVEKGTGKMARIQGMRVAGKTGTAQKVTVGGYSHDKFYASFFGFAPADNPRIAAIVVFDEPHPQHFGSVVCAPVFKEVIENALKYLESSG